ncbi:uncharacterized protein LOC141637950 [Silene latifolia]|uniref:uncharacterized protein LOC141637950 n=1 Tax=Silene latifolia TaxID=37657 RepID=UPI003D788746
MIPIQYSMQRAMLSLSPFLHPNSISSPSQIPHFNPTFLTSKPFTKPLRSSSQNSPTQEQEDDFRVLTATKTEYNNIVILESSTSKILLLDDSCNVHSILYKSEKWTNSYWDEFTTLPAIIPDGPIAVYGLAGGTVAHQLLHFWPGLTIHGWELDEILVDRARQFFRLSELEQTNSSGGILKIHVGDALSRMASVEGGYAGIVVDLFSDAKVLQELEKAETWLEMKEKVMLNGRIMVNCGGEIMSDESGWETNSTIRAMCEAFGKELVNWKKMPLDQSGNYLAFTGSLPDFDLWCNAVPERLGSTVALWRACG